MSSTAPLPELPAGTSQLEVTLLRAALLGAAAWALSAGLLAWNPLGAPAALPWAAPLLLLGPLVAVPLGLRALAPLGPTAGWHLVAGAILPAALLTGVSLLLPPGKPAAALAAPWAVVCGLIGLLGLGRLRGAGRSLTALTLAAGPALLPVGGVWLLAARADVALVGFTAPWQLLTAAHFHFAGFTLPILAGLVARAQPGRVIALACAGVLLGVPLVAAGITLSRTGPRWPEWLAGWLLAGAGLLVAGEQLRLGALRARGGRAALLVLSGGALLVGLTLAGVWSLGRGLSREWLSLSLMVRTHAAINVLGFALPGLLAWNALGVQLRWAGRRPALDELVAWEALEPAPEAAGGPLPGAHLDEHVAVIGREPPGPPLEDGPHRRAAAAILAYDVFPRALLRTLVRRTPVQAGDTVGALYRLVPGLELRFASRVVDVFDRQEGELWRTGFTYRTLPGHPELGEETFAVEKHLPSGEVEVSLRAWSLPGAPPVRALAPLARLVQWRAGRRALRHLRAHAERPLVR